MNAEKRKAIRVKVQTHPNMAALRKQLVEAALQLPAVLPENDEKLATLIRRCIGGKMPKRVGLMLRGQYMVRGCVGGVVFAAGVFNSLGARENYKLVGPMSRLSDAIAYRFRHSRMRGTTDYNLNVEQAKADSEILDALFRGLSNALTDCGVPISTPVPVTKEFPPLDSEGKLEVILKRLDVHVERMEKIEAQINKLESIDVRKDEVGLLNQYVTTLEKRIEALESIDKTPKSDERFEYPVTPIVMDAPAPGEKKEFWFDAKL